MSKANLEFEVVNEDFISEFHPYDEQDGVVATAFKRQFPEMRFVCAHGDYYIGLGKKNDYVRYEFRIEDQPKIQALFYLTDGEKFDKFTLAAVRK